MTLRTEQIARVVHEANRALQVERADPTIGIGSAWDDLDDETRQSAIIGVAGVLAGDTPEQSHATWMKGKIDAGWTHGPVKSAAWRDHPSLVDYAAIPDDEKLKDHLFVAVVKALTSP